MTEGCAKTSALSVFNQFLETQGRNRPVSRELQEKKNQDKKEGWRYFRLTRKGLNTCSNIIDGVRCQLVSNNDKLDETHGEYQRI